MLKPEICAQLHQEENSSYPRVSAAKHTALNPPSDPWGFCPESLISRATAGHMDTSPAILADEPEDLEFMQILRRFLKTEYSVELDLSLGWKTPTVGGQKLDLSMLYREVVKRGGHKEVTVTKQWKQVADVFNLPKSLTSSSFLMRTHYERFLYEFESRHFLHKPASEESFNSKLISPSWSLPNNHQVASGAHVPLLPPNVSATMNLHCSPRHPIVGAIPPALPSSSQLGTSPPFTMPPTSTASPFAILPSSSITPPANPTESPNASDPLVHPLAPHPHQQPFTPTATKPALGQFPLLPGVAAAVAAGHYPLPSFALPSSSQHYPLPPFAPPSSSNSTAITFALAAQAYLASQPHAAAATAAAAVSAEMPALHIPIPVAPVTAAPSVPPAPTPASIAAKVFSYGEPARSPASPSKSVQSQSTITTSPVHPDLPAGGHMSQAMNMLNVQQLQMILQAAHEEAVRAVQPTVHALEERLLQVEELHLQLAMLVKNFSTGHHEHRHEHAAQEHISKEGSATKKSSSTDSIGDEIQAVNGDNNRHCRRGFAPYERTSHLVGSHAHLPGHHSLHSSTTDRGPGTGTNQQGGEMASYSENHAADTCPGLTSLELWGSMHGNTADRGPGTLTNQHSGEATSYSENHAADRGPGLELWGSGYQAQCEDKQKRKRQEAPVAPNMLPKRAMLGYAMPAELLRRYVQ